VIKTSMKRAMLFATAIAFVTWGGRAHASGFQLVEANGSGLGNAYSGQAAAAEDASTIFFNPAGLTRLPRLQLVGAITLISTSTEFTNNGTTRVLTDLQPTLGGTGGDAGDVAWVPNAYVSYEAIPGKIWAGLGVNVPFGLKTEWAGDWMGRFHAVKSEVKTININPTVAWKATPWLSIGAGANAQWIDAELTNSVNYSAIAFGVGGPAALAALAAAGCGTLAGGCEGLGKVTGNDWSWGWNVGVMLEAAKTHTRVGASYRSKVEQEIEGDVTFSNRPVLLANALPNGPVRTTIELPDWFSVAVAQQVIPRLELLADFTWTHWSKIQDLSIFRTSGAPLTSTPLQFDDSWRIGLGANYQATPMLKLRLGVAYDTTPVKDEFRTPRLPDEDRTWLAGGVQWAFSKAGAIDVGLAYLFISDASSNLPSVDPSQPPGFQAVPKGNLKGEYEANAWIASAQAKYSF
jgi:long-chain fatty acid transport protein